MNLSKTKEFSLTDKELKHLRDYGYVGPFDLYESDEIKAIWRRERIRLLDRTNAIYKENTISGSTNIANYDRHLDNEFLAKHICLPQITHRLSSLVGENLTCWRSEFFPKYPGDAGTDWHQADTFENAGGKPQLVWPDSSGFGGTLSVWTAFSDTDRNSACLQFIPGTHEEMFYDEHKAMEYNPELNDKLERNGERKSFFGYDYRNLQKDSDWEPDESKAVSIEMKAGQFVIFWSTLMHASHAHKGLDNQPMRMGYSVRYVPSFVDVYPNLEEITQFGGSISLENYGTVVVSGENLNSKNKVATHTMGGTPFSDYRE
ncbi:chlorinating enzyme [Croceitalea marina]|uniref:Chlorinating enzyme n=1 Tax=Croceitalea marina TaxID=1775166 RepID=A0ABW5MXY4_9FLAO